MKRFFTRTLPLLCLGAMLGGLTVWFLLSRSAALALTRRGAEGQAPPGEVWTLAAADGVTLRAYAQAAGAGEKWVLLLHGWGGCAGDLEALGAEYRLRGWSTLIPDLRGCGLSGGERQGLGLGDREDILAWMGRIRERSPEAELVLHGVSMGACAALCAAGTRPEGLAAVVADSAFTDLWDLGQRQLLALTGEKQPLLEWGASAVTAAVTGFGFSALCPRRQTAGTRAPILFLRGEGDGLVPADMGESLLRCAPKGSSLITLPCGHAQGFWDNGEAYLTAVFAFLTGCSGSPQTP